MWGQFVLSLQFSCKSKIVLKNKSYRKKKKKKEERDRNLWVGISLVAQEVRLRVPNAEGLGSIPIRELDPRCCN